MMASCRGDRSISLKLFFKLNLRVKVSKMYDVFLLVANLLFVLNVFIFIHPYFYTRIIYLPY